MGLLTLFKRLIAIIPVFLGVVTAVFFMIRFAPGGPFDSERAVSPEILRNLNEKYHLNDSIFQQYTRYLGALIQGDLGPSFKHANRSVNEIIAQSFPVSLELGLYALAWALMIGILSGIVAGWKPNTWFDYVPMSISVLGVCLPTFVIGPVLVLIFAIWVEWLPVAGWTSWKDKILPSFTLGLAYAAYVSRLTRSGFLEIRNQDFIRTARAKGLSETRILFKHAFRGGILPVVSFLGPAIAGIITGALVTETIFNIPGLGRFFIQSALNRDYTVVMGTSLLYFLLIFACNFLVDVAYILLDPRVRYE